MKRILALTIILLLGLFVFAEDSYRTYLPSLVMSPVYPIDSSIGQIVSNRSSDAHKLLNEALSEPFSFEWCEKYIAENSRKNITTIFSSVLSELLPAESFICSRAYKNADNSYSVSVKFTESNSILTFVVLNNLIIGLSSSKK